MTILEQTLKWKGRGLIAISLGTDNPASATLPTEEATFLGHPGSHSSLEPKVLYPLALRSRIQVFGIAGVTGRFPRATEITGKEPVSKSCYIPSQHLKIHHIK